jgi:hypothetical protein
MTTLGREHREFRWAVRLEPFAAGDEQEAIT